MQFGSDPIFVNESGKFSFYDETWCHVHGEFDTREECVEALKEYCKTL